MFALRLHCKFSILAWDFVCLTILTAGVDFIETKSKSLIYGNDRSKVEGEHSLASRVGVQTCRVTYGGVDGAYYTSTRTTKAGTDGVSNFLRASCFIVGFSSGSNVVILNKVVLEETKEADRTTGQAKHKISRGIHDKVII